ncbi:hypothetical protein SSPS47_01060 [Streptomyces sp. S4.7]|uniref:hypothetical protein n=1 Tax=Streptomyces sp. S4.7 TaxID=2705439 RepID=UPI00139792E1|nr:hypothetical protein [Streptomyces sp. S4.7]QHY93718.1 hypothetical protein SSPS47_01060 [Streptomyces sp. S4.7]
MTDRVLRLLRTRPDLAALAAFPFDLDVDRAYHVADVHLASSEGDAVLMADSVTEALEPALPAAEAGDAPPARETMSHGKELLSTIARQHAEALGELSTRAKWAVAALGRDPG